ncbi:hypothetical protein N7540_012492 [Penicillium herquei]|nr:hypothetical protein N7540_012492 [Penicillium herquei]
MRGLDNAVLVAVPLGVDQVDLAVIPDMITRVSEAYDCLEIDHFGATDPAIKDQICHDETLDAFNNRIGKGIFDSYRQEFLRTYGTLENIPPLFSSEVWAWFDSRFITLNKMLGNRSQKVLALNFVQRMV